MCKGLPEARLTLVEYGDYQCPPCGTLFVTIQEIHEKPSTMYELFTGIIHSRVCIRLPN